MNRKLKRSFKRHDKEITDLVKKLTIKQLKKLEIDYTIDGDLIKSNRTKDVDRLYNTIMFNVISDFTNNGGNISKLKQLYD